jgi:hypothetical protein
MDHHFYQSTMGDSTSSWRSSQDHVTTQVPPLYQSRDICRGIAHDYSPLLIVKASELAKFQLFSNTKKL